MKSRYLFVGLVCSLSACSPIKLYDGEKKADSEVSHYGPGNYSGSGLTTPYQIYSATLDKQSFGNDAGFASQQLLDSLLRGVQINSGQHNISVSLFYLTVETIPVVAGVVMAPGDKAKFPGIYHITFESRPGYLYAPIYNLKTDGATLFDEVCVAEAKYVGLKQSLAATRHPSAAYVGCAKPVLRRDPDVGKLCSTWLAGKLPIPSQLKAECESVIGVAP